MVDGLGNSRKNKKKEIGQNRLLPGVFGCLCSLIFGLYYIALYHWAFRWKGLELEYCISLFFNVVY